VTMAVQRVSKLMDSAVMLVTMAIRNDRISMVMNSVTKMDTSLNNWMVVMLVMVKNLNSVSRMNSLDKI
jgi:hypothetical protein